MTRLWPTRSHRVPFTGFMAEPTRQVALPLLCRTVCLAFHDLIERCSISFCPETILLGRNFVQADLDCKRGNRGGEGASRMSLGIKGGNIRFYPCMFVLAGQFQHLAAQSSFDAGDDMLHTQLTHLCRLFFFQTSPLSPTRRPMQINLDHTGDRIEVCKYRWDQIVLHVHMSINTASTSLVDC